MSINRRQTTKGWVYDVRLRRPDGRPYKRTFPTKKEALDFESAERLRRAKGEYFDPDAGRVRFEEFGSTWLKQRLDLRPRTRELYDWLLRKHINPVLGSSQVGQLRIADVREWRAQLLSAGVGAITVAKAYRLLRTILASAVEEGCLVKNPCAIRGAGAESSAERSTATVEEVYALAAAVPERNRALVLLAAFSGLRLGELLALRRDHLDLDDGVVVVAGGQHELRDRSIIVGPPKTAAGRRTVSIPPHLVPTLAQHLDHWVGPEKDALVFTGDKGGWLRRSQWNARWRRTRAVVGLPHLTFHDLRHTGNTLAASTGASTKELMNRLGHASAQAALRYQHTTAARDKAIALALSELTEQALGPLRTAATADGCAMDPIRSGGGGVPATSKRALYQDFWVFGSQRGRALS